MPALQESIRPLDGAIVDYCCAFFGRTLTLCWQDLPVGERGDRQVLLNLKDYFLAALTNDFLGCVSAVDEVCDDPFWNDKLHGVEFLDTLESALVRRCTETCATSLLEIQQQLQATSSYNTFAFDPRTIMAYVVAAVLKSKLEHKVGRALCYAFINRLGLSIGLLYGTLADVLKGYVPEAESDSCDGDHSVDCASAKVALNACDVGEPIVRNEIKGLTQYIDRFYTSNLSAQTNPASLSALFQNVYAALLCYVRDSCDSLDKKSHMLDQVLQELYSLTELEHSLFLLKNRTFEEIIDRLSKPEPYLWRTLKYVSEELAVFNLDNDTRYRMATLSDMGQPIAKNACGGSAAPRFCDTGAGTKKSSSDLVSFQAVKSVLDQTVSSGEPSTQHQMSNTNIFQHVERLINDALIRCPVGEVSHFIDRYWRHALLAAGLREGLESSAWLDATTLLADICHMQVMASAGEVLQGIILERMGEIGKHYLNYNDFLEREDYFQTVDAVIGGYFPRVTSRH